MFGKFVFVPLNQQDIYSNYREAVLLNLKVLFLIKVNSNGGWELPSRFSHPQLQPGGGADTALSGQIFCLGYLNLYKIKQ